MSDPSANPEGHDPGRWLLFGLLLPGLGHFLTGKAARGVAALVSSAGLLIAGVMMLQERFLFAELKLAGLPLALPEVLQVVPFAVARSMVDGGGPVAERAARMPIDGESLGFFLAGAGAMIGLFWAADLLWQQSGARRRSGSKVIPPVAAALSWILPGAGHVFAGQRSKGLLVGGMVLGLFFVGLYLGGGHAVDRGHYPIWWAGQNLCGGGSLFAALFTAPREMVEFPEYLDLGIVLCTVAGLLNVIVMSDAYSLAEGTAISLRPGADAVGPTAPGAAQEASA